MSEARAVVCASFSISLRITTRLVPAKARMPDEPRPPVQVFSPELLLKLFQLHVFFSLADRGYYNMLFDREE